MKRFIFRTTTTISRRLAEHYWIDGALIRQMFIDAPDVHKALELWVEWVRDELYIDIRPSALKTKNPMYVDGPNGEVIQCGWVINAWTEIENKKICLELWVHVDEMIYFIFVEV